MDFCLKVKNDLLRVGTVTPHPGIFTFADFEDFLAVVDNEKLPLLDEKLVSMCSTVTSDISLWPLLVNTRTRAEIIENTLETANEIMADPENFRYYQTWQKIRKFINSLDSVYVNNKKWGKLREKYSVLNNEVYKPNIMTGKLKKTKYSQITSTGRLTVSSGPNFLITPAECRKGLTPSRPNSKIAIIDFSAMEPRTLLAAKGINPGKNDLYEEIMSVCDIPDRSTAKLAAISALYGASERRLIETTGSTASARTLIKKVMRYFSVPELEEALEQQSKNAVIRNYFGRPLHVATHEPRVRINHYAQSSAAELSILLFSDLCAKNEYIQPLLVIHDALIVEISGDKIEMLQAALENVQFNDIHFPMTLALEDN